MIFQLVALYFKNCNFLSRASTSQNTGLLKSCRTDMERREFIGKGIKRIFYALGAIILAYPAFSFMTFRRNRKKTIVFHPDEQTSIVNFKKGVFLLRQGSENYALSDRCTHLGCSLNYDPVSRKFRCPCHGSVFDVSGKWLSGPAKKDLYRVPMTKKASGDVEVTIIL